MHLSLILLLFPFAASAAKILVTNDDGWAEMNLRTLFNALALANNSVVLSAPAEKQSEKGSRENSPDNEKDGCQFNSCPPNSPATGSNSSDPRLNYVNAFPVTAMKSGVNLFESKFGGRPDLVIAGINIGTNLGVETVVSGTVGAASAAADQFGIPGIAFSGASGNHTAWDAPTPDYALIYVDLVMKITATLMGSGTPYLPSGTFLNVNFPAAGAGTACTKPTDFRFVLSRIYTSSVISHADVEICGNGRVLPSESSVVHSKGCYVSISVGKASNKLSASKSDEEDVLYKLKHLLSCLPAQ